MIIKAVLLFLVVIALLGMTGRFRRKPGDKSRPAVETARKCPACGAYLVGKTPCLCGNPGPPKS
jgi:hypothetical protein